MSTNLYWRPVPKQPADRELPHALKKAIARRLWDHDGSLNGEDVQIGRNWISYLEGLEDAGVDGAAELIDAIRLHSEVFLTIRG